MRERARTEGEGEAEELVGSFIRNAASGCGMKMAASSGPVRWLPRGYCGCNGTVSGSFLHFAKSGTECEGSSQLVEFSQWLSCVAVVKFSALSTPWGHMTTSDGIPDCHGLYAEARALLSIL